MKTKVEKPADQGWHRQAHEFIADTQKSKARHAACGDAQRMDCFRFTLYEKWVRYIFVGATVIALGSRLVFGTTIDLTSGTSGSLSAVPQSYNETRGVDVTVLSSSDLHVTSMTLDGLQGGGASSAFVGARIYDSSSSLLIASAGVTIFSSGSVVVPISATLVAGGNYRVAFYVETTPLWLASAYLFDPNPLGAGGFPYIETTGLLQINSPHQIGADSFPSGNSFDSEAQISLNVSTNNCCDGCTTNNYVRYTNTVNTGFNFLVNNLCHGTNNTVGVLLPNVPQDTELLKWNYASQNFDPHLIFDLGGWAFFSSGTDASGVTLEPGEGFVLQNTSGAAFNIIFEGCEPTNCPLPCLPRANGCVLVGRLGLGTATWTNLSSCPPICGTEVRIWNGSVFINYDYFNNSWHDASGTITPEPVLAPGQSAFVCLTNCPCPCPSSNNAAVPPNDLCANATPISTGIYYGYTFSATASPLGSLTPTPCGQSVNSPDVWYTFTTNCPGGTVTLDTCLDPCVNFPPSGSSAPFDTVLSVYTGTCPLLSQVVCNNNALYNACSNSPSSSKVTFIAKPCVTYYIRVAGKKLAPNQYATGCFALNATFQPAIPTAPVNDQPCGAINIPCNQTRGFNTCAATTNGPNPTGCASFKDVWFRYSPTCTGTVSVATCGSFFDTVLGVYTGPNCNNLTLVPGACNDNAIGTGGPCDPSLQSYLTFVAVANTTYWIRVGGANGAACTGKLTVIGPNPPLNTCPPTNCFPKKQRLFQVVGDSTSHAWSWCLSSPCCFNISGTVPAGTVPAGQPASALVAAMVASINAVCSNTAMLISGINNSNKFKIKACICSNNCPNATAFVFRVGAAGASCDDMCVVNSPIIVSTTGPCVFNPAISEVPLSEQDCNQNGEDDTLDILNGTSQDNDENGVPDECPIRLDITYETLDNEVVISWAATDAILEQSASVTGPWGEVPGATNPYSVAPATGQGFFRLRLP